MEARLLLEDGTRLEGQAFGAKTEKLGEVVFSTGMTGYQEVLTDPSCCGQMVIMTYPLIGNCGINRHDFESKQSFIHGLIVREHATSPNHWRNEQSLDCWLKEGGIPGIAGVDTRMLTRKIRAFGTLKGVLSTTGAPWDVLAEKLEAGSVMRDQRSPGQHPDHPFLARIRSPGGSDGLWGQVRDSAGADPPGLRCGHGALGYFGGGDQTPQLRRDPPFKRTRKSQGCTWGDRHCGHSVEAIPPVWNRSGPSAVRLGCWRRYGEDEVWTPGFQPSRQRPAFRKDPYHLSESRVYGANRLSGSDGSTLTHIALNDGTCEGLAHKHLPAFSVQYHPEAAPGPHDSGSFLTGF